MIRPENGSPGLLEVAQRILDRGYVSSCIEEERQDHDDLRAAIAAASSSQVGSSRPDAGDEDVERVARAICVAEELDPDGPHPEDTAEGRTDGFPLWTFYAHAARAALAAMREGVDRGMVERLRTELAWYGEQARLARLIHSEGDAGRNALSADGGKRATAALSPEQPR